ncbi:transmembrane protein, putative (macronuclear) [Tetrahymena thermophila SB210]|uniref:Transmembrane protein, putative n=1 Tax=Tetrahymena thermophila (strain SB210) TaxID=312017 RepID=Q23DB6_TETTS|nr:transmembrane protein, putative [Tetrahymena thermophila SB210]EAR94359.2 transmembrane protein, putative [Tetrahymena thermophila SB210]|eukprot:XP_001014770.2 transmembrane protein, putative [Tetrahymena thermophila SB210]
MFGKSKEEEELEKKRFIISNVSLILFCIPYIFHLGQIEIGYQVSDYQTYLWFGALAYGVVTYGYVCDRIHDLFMFVIIFTIQLHSAIFFFLQNIFKLSYYQKIVMTAYLSSICLFMNLMIREYNRTKKEKKEKKTLVQTKLVYFVNQCSGTIFAQILFIVLKVIDVQNFKVLLQFNIIEFIIYIAFSCLSVFGLLSGIYIIIFKKDKLKKNTYNRQQHWFYFTGLNAFFCFVFLKWSEYVIYEQYILVLTFCYIFMCTLEKQCETWFFVISIILVLGQIAIQVLFQLQFHDIWIHICSGINDLIFIYQIYFKIDEYYHNTYKKRNSLQALLK